MRTTSTGFNILMHTWNGAFHVGQARYESRMLDTGGERLFFDTQRQVGDEIKSILGATDLAAAG